VPYEVPVLLDEELSLLHSAASDLEAMQSRAFEAEHAMIEAAQHVGRVLTPIREALDKIALDKIAETRASAAAARRPNPTSPEPGAPAPRPRPAPVAAADGDVKLGKGELTVLEVLAEYPEGRTQNELAFLAGYSAKASTIGVILSNLRKGGLVEPGQPIRATQAGFDTVGGVRERPTGQALLDQWLRHPRMGEGERKVLLELISWYDAEPTHAELCERTGYSPTASTMGVILSKLRKLGLVEKGRRRVAPEFMEAIS